MKEEKQKKRRGRRPRRFRSITGRGLNGKVEDIKVEEIPQTKVSGFGERITVDFFRQMISEYFLLQSQIRSLLDLTDQDAEIQKLINEIRTRLKPEEKVISGIYGKDAIMEILNQDRCEGIRYINCVFIEEDDDNNKDDDGSKLRKEESIILVGVDTDGKVIGDFKKEGKNTSISPIALEVKGGSKTISDIQNDYGMDNVQKINFDEGLSDGDVNSIINAILS